MDLEHCKLRPIEMEDADGIYAIRSNELMIRYTDISQMKSLTEAKAFIKARLEDMEKRTALYYVLADKTTDQLLGTICLWQFSSDYKSCDIGYELLPAYQGKGIMTEALTYFIQYAFESLKVSCIHAAIQKDNTASIQLIKRAGFTLTRLLDDTYELYSIKSVSKDMEG